MEKGGNAEGETPLSGGFVREPVKVGDTVKRAIGPWSPAAHALLEHLESAGYNDAGRGSPLGPRAVVRVVPGLLAERALEAADRGADRRAPSARDGGEMVEVFGPSLRGQEQLSTGPVVGFLVDDVALARQEMEERGIEFVGPVHAGDAGAAWSHLRRPDGKVYEIKQVSDDELRERERSSV
jgi:hypothetical protein